LAAARLQRLRHRHRRQVDPGLLIDIFRARQAEMGKGDGSKLDASKGDGDAQP
jgi:hypothetical protein